MTNLKQRIKRNETLYWTNLTIYNEQLPIFIQKAGYDFLVIDGLNSIYDSLDKAAIIIQVCRSIGLPVLYRSNIEDKLLKAMDLGADGVAWMNAANGESIRAFKNKLFFYPKGNKRPNPYTGLGNYGHGDFKEIKQRYNEDTIFWVFIEDNIKDIDLIEGILSEEDIDIVYLGQYVNEKSKESVERCRLFAETARKNGIGVAGFHYQMEKEAYQKMDTLKFSLQIPNVIGISCDTKIIIDGFQRSLELGKHFVKTMDGWGK